MSNTYKTNNAREVHRKWKTLQENQNEYRGEFNDACYELEHCSSRYGNKRHQMSMMKWKQRKQDRAKSKQFNDYID